MSFNINNEGKVHEIANAIRSLNRLGEDTLYVCYGSWHEIVYAGDVNKLILPRGYYISTYKERENVVPCITNRGNTGSNSHWTFVVKEH